MFRKIRKSSLFFFPVIFVQSEMKVKRESSFPTARISMAAFPAESSQCTVASAALILKLKAMQLPTCSLFHFSSPLQSSSAGAVKWTEPAIETFSYQPIFYVEICFLGMAPALCPTCHVCPISVWIIGM